MKKFLLTIGIFAICTFGNNAFALSAGTVSGNDTARVSTPSNDRGYQSVASTYKTNQRNTYYMVTQPDVDTACRTKIYNCLAAYCGDVTVVPGQRDSRCTYSTESELYNYALLCLQKDTDVLMPQYNTGTRTGTGGMNTAARLCPSYVQQELMSYLSMANMAEKLTKSRSSLCLERRQELEAAMSCHSITLSYGNETSSMLNSQLTDYCGSGVPGGSSEMVTKFANAGNVGANIWGWAEKVVNLDLNKKGADWQVAVDAVLAGYTNRMNLACGDDAKVTTSSYSSNNSQPTSLQTAAALAVGMAFPTTEKNSENIYESLNMWQEVQSASDVYDYATAKQVVQAGLTNAATTQNAFLNSSQMDSMQTSYKLGTKVFILRDSSRCYIVPVATLDAKQKSLLAQSFANCVSQ
ncbi:MAG: hypothetical protein JW974_00365 [Alphaproteobacteria bacterium]|nr:hypothetical protein [Alphaproteobacteria bacterium]MBN2675204.1 hypothetical protein [Alphaproteobacteria bacterium]